MRLGCDWLVLARNIGKTGDIFSGRLRRRCGASWSNGRGAGGVLAKGGFGEKTELDESTSSCAAPDEELLAVHQELDRLAAEDAAAAALVKLRYFVGMTMPKRPRRWECRYGTRNGYGLLPAPGCAKDLDGEPRQALERKLAGFGRAVRTEGR